MIECEVPGIPILGSCLSYLFPFTFCSVNVLFSFSASILSNTTQFLPFLMSESRKIIWLAWISHHLSISQLWESQDHYWLAGISVHIFLIFYTCLKHWKGPNLRWHLDVSKSAAAQAPCLSHLSWCCLWTLKSLSCSGWCYIRCRPVHYMMNIWKIGFPLVLLIRSGYVCKSFSLSICSCLMQWLTSSAHCTLHEEWQYFLHMQASIVLPTTYTGEKEDNPFAVQGSFIERIFNAYPCHLCGCAR